MVDPILEQVRRLRPRRRKRNPDDKPGVRRLMRRQDGTGPHGVGMGPGRGVRAQCDPVAESRGDPSADAAFWLLQNRSAAVEDIQERFGINEIEAGIMLDLRNEAVSMSRQTSQWLSGMLLSNGLVESDA